MDIRKDQCIMDLFTGLHGLNTGKLIFGYNILEHWAM